VPTRTSSHPHAQADGRRPYGALLPRSPTTEFLIAGAGQPHIEAIISKLKRATTPTSSEGAQGTYRETVRGIAEAQGGIKKQTGGHGQFGDCKLRIEPQPRAPASSSRTTSSAERSPASTFPQSKRHPRVRGTRYLAGYPVVDIKVTVFDGSYHDVDSSEMSFKMAARLAFRKCMEQAKPALLEPVMRVEIDAPEEFAGALIGDLTDAAGGCRAWSPAVPEQSSEPKSHGRNSELQHRAHLYHGRTRQLPHGDEPLRCGAAAARGKDPRRPPNTHAR